jgi:uncharacterized membrane protein
VIVGFGVMLAIGLSYTMALWSPAIVTVANNSQVAGRVQPNITDLVVALASGAAGAFALSRRNVSDALPGVAIAISLVPPLCVVGVMMANHDPSASAGAALLFLTNFVSILIAGGVLLAIMGYGRAAIAEHVRGRRAAVLVITLATLVIAVPLGITGRQIAQDSIREFQVQRAAAAKLPAGYQLVDVTSKGGTLQITVEGPPTDVATIANQIAQAAHSAYPGVAVRVALVTSQIADVPPTSQG